MKSTVRTWATAVGTLLVVAVLLPCARAQTGTFFPSTEFTYGAFMTAQTICYSNNINTQAIRLTPITRTFTFTPTTAQGGVRYIRITSPSLRKFYAQVVNGGVGTVNPIPTNIVVTSVHGGYLNVAVRIYCGAATQGKLSARIVQGGVDMVSLQPISVALTSDYGGRLNAETDQGNVRYIEVSAFAAATVTAQIVSGGIGTKYPTLTQIFLSAPQGGSFSAAVKIYCGA
uniref:Uncharacterized protein n=1 Tax=Anopheles minimus TaxID=112268 RepID=A0A182WIE8_9DIPT